MDTLKDGEEVNSPLKESDEKGKGKKVVAGNTNRQLFQEDSKSRSKMRKQKADKRVEASHTTPDLNLPSIDTRALVPLEVVNSQVASLDGNGGVGDLFSKELKMKQRMSGSNQNALSAAAAGSNPRRAQ